MEKSANLSQKIIMLEEEINDYIPQGLSLSKVAWVSPGEYRKENYNRKPESNIDDEMALKVDFTKSNPPSDVIRRRAKYRPHMWHNFIPKSQRFMIFTTYGPEEQGYDIDSPKIGFEFFGCFEDLEQVKHQILTIRKYNPHAVFLTFHTVDVGMGKRIEFPPPNDGSAQTFHLNTEHQTLMQKHLNKAIDSVEYVENRVENSIKDLKKRNEIVDQYNLKIQKHAKNLLGMNEDEIKAKILQSKSKIHGMLEDVKFDQSTIMDQLKQDMKSLTYDQVEDFISTQNDLMNLPKGYRIIYQRFLNNDGKEYLVRSIQYSE